MLKKIVKWFVKGVKKTIISSLITNGAAFIRNNLTTNILQVLICYVGGFFCLIPLYYQPKSHLEESLLRHSINSVGYKYSSIAILALVIPVILDCITDLFFTLKKEKEDNNTIVREGFLNNLEKVLFLSGVVILPIVAFFPESTKNWAFIYLCCNKCQQIFVYGALMISLSRYNNKCWTNRTTYITITSIALANAILSNVNNNETISARLRLNLDGFSFVLIVFGSLLFLISAIRWFLGPVKRQFRLLFKKTKSKEKSELFFSVVYISMTILYIVIMAIFRSYFDRLEYYNAKALWINNLIYFAYVLFIIFISMRMVKSEVVQGLVSSFWFS
jgi:hypothetical protein